MDRVEVAASMLKGVEGIESVLDVGCRDGALRSGLRPGVEYVGADLVPGSGHVRYVGDFNDIEFDRQFTATAALDVLEHMEHPARAFDKLVAVSSRYVIVSLPNCYDLKTRVRFALQGRMGGKYEFHTDEPVDRHRWVMGYNEIAAFYRAKAEQFDLKLTIVPLRYGFSGLSTFRSRLGALLAKFSSPSLTSETVIGLFEKRGA